MNPRCPLSVRVIGVMQHQKRKTFLTSVLWSDQNDVIVYRTFEEFKKLHKTLVQKFPVEAGRIKKSDRILPKFQDISLKDRRHRRVSKSVLRVQLLEKYCSNLLDTSAKISQCQDVVQFFLPNSQDLKPSFPSNSIVIMPSGAGEQTGDLNGPNKTSIQSITQPGVLESYRCIASYETKDTKNKAFKILEGEIVDVVAKNPSGWWLVENDEKQLAWFPAPYLKKCLNAAPSVLPNNDERGCLYYVVTSYEATNEKDELSIQEGVIIQVLQKSNDGWWLVRYAGQTGYVPSVYLQQYRNPHSKFQMLTKANMYTSTPNLLASVSFLENRSNGALRSHTSPVDQTQGGNKETMTLTRKLSKSINYLPDNTTYNESFHNSIESESGSESNSDDISMTTVSSSKSHSSEDVSLSESYSARPASDDEPAKNNSAPVLSEKSSATVPKPQIPPRPHTHEILTKCSTVTKNIILKAQNKKPPL
ncbi:NADPH oxidase organizer 1 [Callorhinchus milii]|uniref:NADPH oxidase organizer 1-like protein n=1 Tax=Callorhinchus milii TaxID=7868 RepID=A0A4W3JRD1_CALMI|nr:NADPH oxidase organizer 1 [Callorhinchus milii]|eukprot:gi/632975516/ref/XP_007904273.1/ PREDICTED: NADPH oxidase organizer 1 [Callorhinchus milii]